MVPLEVFTDHNWRWHIQDPKLPFRVCKKWELSRVHRTKERGEKLAALIGKQSNVVKTPKEVARHRKPSTAHSAQKRHLKFWGRSAPESPGLTSLQSSTSGTSRKYYLVSPLATMILKRETPMTNFFGMILCLLSLPIKRVWKRPCPVSVSMHGPQTFPPLNSDHRAAPRGRPVTRGVYLGWCRSIKLPPTDPGFLWLWLQVMMGILPKSWSHCTNHQHHQHGTQGGQRGPFRQRECPPYTTESLTVQEHSFACPKSPVLLKEKAEGNVIKEWLPSMEATEKPAICISFKPY